VAFIACGLIALPLFGTASARAAAPARAPRHAQAGISWVPAAPSPFQAARFDGEYEPATDRIFILGFKTPTGTDGSVWYYDIDAKTYIDTGVDMPIPVSDYEVVKLKDGTGHLGFYIFGGMNAKGSVVTDVQVYWPDTNTAQVVASDPWPGTTPSGCTSLPATGATAIGHTAYVLGGLAFSSAGCAKDEQSAQTWMFTARAKPGHRWTQGPDLHVARGYISPAVLQGRIYAIGGDKNSAGTLTPTATVESWTPGESKWDNRNTPDLPEACDESQAFGFAKGAWTGGIVLTGCGQWPNASADSLLYDGPTKTWTVIGQMSMARRNFAAAETLSGNHPKVLVIGGYAADTGFSTPTNAAELGKGVD
jgi:hypothetical protein